MEENKTESERNEDESQENKKWIESLGFENLPVEEWRTHEEQTKNGEERWKIFTKFFTQNVSEASRKHLGLNFLHGNTIFHPKQLKCIA